MERDCRSSVRTKDSPGRQRERPDLLRLGLDLGLGIKTLGIERSPRRLRYRVGFDIRAWLFCANSRYVRV